MNGQPETWEEWRSWGIAFLDECSRDQVLDSLADMGQQVTYLHRVRDKLQASLATVTSPNAAGYEPGDEDTADVFVSARDLLKRAGWPAPITSSEPTTPTGKGSST